MRHSFILAALTYLYFSASLGGLEEIRESQDSSLTLEMAWRRTAAYAPSLDMADIEIGIKEAEKIQAALIPNPIANIEVENIWGSGIYKGWDAAETTYSLWQTVELGGKRDARRHFAASQTSMAYWEAKISEQNLYYTLVATFIEAYKFQEKLKIAYERLKVAETTAQIVDTQVMAGKVSPIQNKRAQTHLNLAQVALKEAQLQAMQFKKKLAWMWGSSLPDFESVAFNFYENDSPISLCELAPGLFDTPDFAKSEQAIFAASQNLKLQKANRVPDLTVRAGYRTHKETNDYAFVIEAQLPLPIFNQNQGNIEKARLEIKQAAFKREEITRHIKEKISLLHGELAAAFEQAKLIQSGVLAEALETYHLTQEGYQKGKLQYLDLLDAQKMLFEIQEQYIERLAIYHLKKAEIERWVGNQFKGS